MGSFIDPFMKLYIAGPISGLQDFNKHSFHDAERMWIARGLPPSHIFNPINHEVSLRIQKGEAKDLPAAYRQCMIVDMDWISKYASALYMLKGWEKSLGAKAEHALGVALGLDIMYET